jgi:hypothetical protein
MGNKRKAVPEASKATKKSRSIPEKSAPPDPDPDSPSDDDSSVRLVHKSTYGDAESPEEDDKMELSLCNFYYY